MSSLVVLNVICALVLVTAALPYPKTRPRRFDKQKVYRVIPTTDEHLDLLKNLKDQGEDGVGLVRKLTIEKQSLTRKIIIWDLGVFH